MTISNSNGLWVRVLPSVVGCRLRLFCIPYAGGGTSVFRDWQKTLPDYVEVCLIQLPGREERSREIPYTRMPLMIKALWRAIEGMLDKPYVLFGHSMGALIAYELAHYTRYKSNTPPAHLMVSGHRAPHLPARDAPMHALSDDKFIAKLRAYSGTPELLLDHPDFMKIYLPLMRADFALCETYNFDKTDVLHCPITVLFGDNDPDTNAFEISSWEEHTSSNMRKIQFRGNHFFIQDAQSKVLESVRECIESVDNTAYISEREYET